MMIEAVPFFHILVNIIQSELGDDVSLPDPSGPFLIFPARRHCLDDHGLLRL